MVYHLVKKEGYICLGGKGRSVAVTAHRLFSVFVFQSVCFAWFVQKTMQPTAVEKGGRRLLEQIN